MLSRLKALLTPPTFEDEELTSAAAILHTIILLTFWCLAIASIPSIINTPSPEPVLLIFVLTLTFLIGLYIALRRGIVRPTAQVMVLGIGVIITLANWYYHGPYSPGLGSYTVLVLIAGILLGRRAAILAAVISSFTVIAIGIAGTVGALPESHEIATPLLRSTLNSLYYLLAALILYVTIGLVNDAVRRLRDNQQKLTEAMDTLQSTSFSKNYVDNILRSMNNLLLVMDASGKIQTANPAALAALGYSEDELVKAPIQLIFDAGFQNGQGEENTRSSEANFIAKDGRRIPVAYTQAMMRADDGKVEGVVLVAQDITERHIAEADRLRNAMRYRALFEQSNDAVFLLNLQGQHIAVNHRASDLLGYSVSELLSLSANEIVVQRELQKSQQVLELLKAGRSVAPYERTFRHKDGREIPVEISVQLVYDADGKPLHIQSIVRDITERKQAEQNLSYQAMLLDNVFDAVISTDMNNIIQSWNKAAENVYGWKAEEVIGKKLSEIVPTEFESDSEDFIRQQYIVRGYWRSEVTQRDREGNKLHMLSSVAILRDGSGELIGTVSVNHDITARKQVELELQNHLLQLAALRQVDVEINSSLEVENVLWLSINAAALLSGADAGYILLQDEQDMMMRQVFGRYTQRSEAPVKPSGIIARVVERREPELLLDMRAAGAAALPDTQAQIVFPLVSHGQLIGILNLETGNAEEFSQEKFDFLRILSSRIASALDNARLFQITQQQLAELQTLYEKVKNLEALKTDMIRIASHDLRSPVGVIKGYMEILTDDLADRISVDEKGYLEMMRRSLNRIQGIISDILSLQRIEELAQNPASEVVDLGLMAHQVVQESEEGAKRRKHALTPDIAPAQLLVQADPAQIHEAMINLVDNAMKYTPEGGQIQMRLCRDGEYARFEVEDNGYGIPDEMQKRLFEPFYRAKSKETVSIDGTGLGLHLVRNIVERYSGRMVVRSVYGKGSTFGFELPVIPGT
jgi:PAS domain S-box-containing protein